MNVKKLLLGVFVSTLIIALGLLGVYHSKVSRLEVQATGNGNGNGNGDCTECPTFEFSARECPAGYHEFGPVFCEKNGAQFDLEPYLTFGPIQVTYNKSEDPHKCHRPSPASLDIPSWAVNNYNSDLEEHVDAVEVECPLVDLCENLDGVQSELPPNYQEEEGQCSCQEGYHQEEYGNNHIYEIPECVRDEEPEPEPEPEVPQEPVVHENLAPACPDHTVPPVPQNVHGYSGDDPTTPEVEGLDTF